MCGPAAPIIAAAAAVVSAGGQIYSGMAAKAQGKYEQAVANQNADLEKRAQRDAIDRAETEQIRHYRRLAQSLGAARVRNAGAGLDIGFGSAASLEEDIGLMGWEDSETLAQNASREVMGYDISAANYINEGKAARARGKAAMTSSIIGAGGTLLSAASSFAKANAGNKVDT